LRWSEVFLEERQRALRGQIGGGLVITGGAGVVVEGMLRAGIDVFCILLVVGLQRSLIGGNASVHALVVLCVVQQQWSLDVGHLGCRDLPAVVGDAGIEL